jgi:hypothetical protein
LEIKLRHPNKDSEAQGRYIEDAEDQILILSWWHWNGNDFGGVLTTWEVSDWDIQLREVYVKEKKSGWKLVHDEDNLGDWVPDRHKRIVRGLGRERFKLTQFYRLKL